MSRERNWYIGGRSYIRAISPEQKASIINWIEEVKGGKPSQSEHGLMAQKGFVRERWVINDRNFFIHTDPDRSGTQSCRIQLICGTHHARELKKAGILKV